MTEIEGVVLRQYFGYALNATASFKSDSGKILSDTNIEIQE